MSHNHGSVITAVNYLNALAPILTSLFTTPPTNGFSSGSHTTLLSGTLPVSR